MTAFVPGSRLFGGGNVPSSPRGVKPSDTYFSQSTPGPSQTLAASGTQVSYSSMPAPPVKSEIFVPSPRVLAPPSQTVKSEVFVPGSSVLAPPSQAMTSFQNTEPFTFSASMPPMPSIPAPLRSETLSAPQGSFKYDMNMMPTPNYTVPVPAQTEMFVPNSTVLAPQTITSVQYSLPPEAPPQSARQTQSSFSSFIPGSQAILPPASMQNIVQAPSMSMVSQPAIVETPAVESQVLSYSMPPPTAVSMTPSLPAQNMQYQPPPPPQQMQYQPPPPPQPRQQEQRPIYTKGGSYGGEHHASAHGEAFGSLTSFLPGFAHFGGHVEEDERFISRRPLGFAEPRVVVLEDRKDDDWYEDAADFRYMNDPKMTSGHAWYDRQVQQNQWKKQAYLPDAHGFEEQALMENPEDFRIRPYMGLLEVEGRDDRQDNCRMA